MSKKNNFFTKEKIRKLVIESLSKRIDIAGIIRVKLSNSKIINKGD